MWLFIERGVRISLWYGGPRGSRCTTPWARSQNKPRFTAKCKYPRNSYSVSSSFRQFIVCSSNRLGRPQRPTMLWFCYFRHWRYDTVLWLALLFPAEGRKMNSHNVDQWKEKLKRPLIRLSTPLRQYLTMNIIVFVTPISGSEDDKTDENTCLGCTPLPHRWIVASQSLYPTLT